MNLLPLTLLSVLALVALPACKKSESGSSDGSAKTEAPAHGADEPAHDELPKRVHVSSKVIEATRVKANPAAKSLLVATLDLPGEVVADPDRSARLATPVPGRLTSVRFKEGGVVKKGEALATVRIPELGRIRGAHNATVAKSASARANADRLAALAEKGLAAKQDAVSARAEADALDAEAAALKEQLSALGVSGNGSELVLRAPVSGVVVSRDAVVGQPVSTEQTIATIADLDEVWFLGRVFEKDLGRLRLGARAEVALNAYANERFDGSVEYLGKQIDPVARTVTARIRLKNRNDVLRLGLFGSARIAAEDPAKRAPVLNVPRSAVVDVAGKTVVFVKSASVHEGGTSEGEDFDMHEVVLGESSLGRVEIVSGLREGEVVVDEGVFTLKSAVLKRTFAEDE